MCAQLHELADIVNALNEIEVELMNRNRGIFYDPAVSNLIAKIERAKEKVYAIAKRYPEDVVAECYNPNFLFVSY